MIVSVHPTVDWMVAVRSCKLLIVALQLHTGGVSGAVRHALVLVYEDAVLLYRDLLLQGHPVVLQLLEGGLGILQLSR